MDFTANDECGILIEGYDEPSMILEPGTRLTTGS